MHARGKEALVRREQSFVTYQQPVIVPHLGKDPFPMLTLQYSSSQVLRRPFQFFHGRIQEPPPLRQNHLRKGSESYGWFPTTFLRVFAGPPLLASNANPLQRCLCQLCFCTGILGLPLYFVRMTGPMKQMEWTYFTEPHVICEIELIPRGRHAPVG